MTIKMVKGSQMVIPRWFLMLVFGLAGLTATAWAGWVTNTCKRVETVCVQVSQIMADIDDMKKDIKYLVRREKEK